MERLPTNSCSLKNVAFLETTDTGRQALSEFTIISAHNTRGIFCRAPSKLATFLVSSVLAMVIGGATTPTTQDDLNRTVSALQKRYSGIRDLRMDFIQTYKTPCRGPRTETGILYLKRPGMMRWEYRSPAEKLFVSDGKNIFFYLPEERQVQRTSVKDSRDQRLPFLFLLGKGNLKKDFSKVEWESAERPFFPGNRVINAFPKKTIDEFLRVLMEFDPGLFQLQRVTIFDIDGSSSEFVFTNIKENTGLASQIFSFRMPPGVEVIGTNADSN